MSDENRPRPTRGPISGLTDQEKIAWVVLAQLEERFAQINDPTRLDMSEEVPGVFTMTTPDGRRWAVGIAEADPVAAFEPDPAEHAGTTHAELLALMESAGQALFEDREWNAPLYKAGQVVGGNGVNSFEAARALQAVAALLKIPGPIDVYNRFGSDQPHSETF